MLSRVPRWLIQSSALRFNHRELNFNRIDGTSRVSIAIVRRALSALFLSAFALSRDENWFGVKRAEPRGA
jgi:hypothetical protein